MHSKVIFFDQVYFRDGVIFPRRKARPSEYVFRAATGVVRWAAECYAVLKKIVLFWDEVMRSHEDVEKLFRAFVVGSLIMFITISLVSFILANSISDLRSEVRMLKEHHSK